MYIRRIQQISEDHCGPAVLQMLLSQIGVFTTQQEITHLAEAEVTLHEDGVRIDQLALACRKVAPQAAFWYKHEATLEDIRYILQRGYGVGVEWQGLFYESEAEEEDDGDYGHYSIVSYIDVERQALILVDPYKDFADQNRIFDIQVFMRRWWDENEVIDEYTNEKKLVKDSHTLFFVTPKTESFPTEMGFRQAFSF